MKNEPILSIHDVIHDLNAYEYQNKSYDNITNDCFVTNQNHSLSKLPFSQQDKLDQQNQIKLLISNYIQNNKIKIFVGTYMRIPHLLESKCGFPMSLLEINQNYYRIENKFFPKLFDINGPICSPPNKIEFCLPFDWIFLWKYIVDFYGNTTHHIEWVLLLEDDITLCPNIFRHIFNHIDNFNQTDNQCRFVKLGQGMTANLIHVNFLPSLIQTMQIYPKKMPRMWNGSGYTWWKSPDTWIQKKMHAMICTANQSFIFHPNVNKTQSTMEHEWESQFPCAMSIIQ